jgi:hypothetical protein
MATVPEMQARIKGKIWQGIAQSGINVSAIPQTEMDTLVNVVAESVLSELDAMLPEVVAGQVGAPEPAAPDAPASTAEGEKVLWEGRPFMSLGTQYIITSERVRIISGLLSQEREDVELVRVQDIDQQQTVSERILNIGDIHIRSHDPSHSAIVLNNISDPLGVHEILREAVLQARKRHNLVYREQM